MKIEMQIDCSAGELPDVFPVVQHYLAIADKVQVNCEDDHWIYKGQDHRYTQSTLMRMRWARQFAGKPSVKFLKP